MKNRIVFVVIMYLLPIFALAQTTYNPSVQSSNNDGTITEVKLTSTETIIKIRFPKSNRIGGWVMFNSATVLVPCEAWNIQDARRSSLSVVGLRPVSGYEQLYVDAMRRIREGRQIMSDNGWLIRGLGADQLDTQYKTTKGDTYFELHFDRVPKGIEYLYLRELVSEGFEWYGIRINNPFPTVANLGYTEESIKTIIDEQNDGIVGIYQGLTRDDNQYKLGCVKNEGNYKFVFLSCKTNLPHWKTGEVKAVLHPTANPATFQLEWYMADKTINSDCYVVFDGATMKVFVDNKEEGYIKMYPTAQSQGASSSPTPSEWSGSGFALNNSYLVTNYHVIEDAKSIVVKGIKGDFSNTFNAEVVATDKYNDLALLKINDSRFTGFGTIPYKVKTSTSDVGEEIFVLGYPLTSTMGDEIKLTTGVISSKTGFQGDVSLYQISAPVQPGNSGGPLFDSKGNLIGVVSSKHTGAENVGYAIKASYLKNLVESAVSSSVLPSNNAISSQPLTGKVKSVQSFVFMIECSSVASNSHNSYSQQPSAYSYGSGSHDGIVLSPTVTDCTEGLTVTQVELRDYETIISLRVVGYEWVNIDKGKTYISVAGRSYDLRNAQGINYAPTKTYTQNGKLEFELFFDAIPKNATIINLRENTEDGFKAYGIKLR